MLSLRIMEEEKGATAGDGQGKADSTFEALEKDFQEVTLYRLDL